KKLTPALGDRKNVIGYAVAINGKVNNADVFASAALFKKLWPKLLFASSVEAVANKKEKASFGAVKAEAVTKFMAEARTRKARESKTGPGAGQEAPGAEAERPVRPRPQGRHPAAEQLPGEVTLRCKGLNRALPPQRTTTTRDPQKVTCWSRSSSVSPF